MFELFNEIGKLDPDEEGAFPNWDCQKYPRRVAASITENRHATCNNLSLIAFGWGDKQINVEFGPEGVSPGYGQSPAVPGDQPFGEDGCA